ncbi:LacI family DNA-binding transcriptional regulator [Demequina sp. NBRC 110051]|uniref:LacI family DNA-binding transcriptional regulator n=1 Tax=Demequina sp. NBRC 110051 TaxID=1570340 RepID=UPI0009FF00EB|nr:LacI family DNA-binding transcriptional regulator [Demequina sp. NBRC 110051]
MTENSRQRRRGRSAPTIYDVAERAGVNPSTVSRALNQPGRVSAATEARIREVARELNFHINPMARSLPTGRRGTIALVVADITNPVVFGIVRGAERAAAEVGYTLIFAESQESGDVEAAAIERLAPASDGMVLATTRLSDEAIRAVAASTPIIMINREIDGLPSVAADVEPGIAELIAHLAGLGHRSIAFVSGPVTSWTSSRRWEALMREAVAAGLKIVEIGPNVPTVDGGHAAFGRVSASGVTAAVCFNDLVAIGLVKAAYENGVSVPGGLSVSGFDDIFGSALMVPALTTVGADMDEAGARAVRRLLADAGVVPAPHEGDRLPTTLVVRDSTGEARRDVD